MVGYALVAVPAIFLATRAAVRVGRRDYLSVNVRSRAVRLPKWWIVFAWTLAAALIVYWRESGDLLAAAVLALFLSTVVTLALRNFAAQQVRTRAAFDAVARAQRSGDRAELVAARRELTRQALLPQPALAAIFLAFCGWVLFDSGEPVIGYAFAASAIVLLLWVVARLIRRRVGDGAG